MPPCRRARQLGRTRRLEDIERPRRGVLELVERWRAAHHPARPFARSARSASRSVPRSDRCRGRLAARLPCRASPLSGGSAASPDCGVGRAMPRRRGRTCPRRRRRRHRARTCHRHRDRTCNRRSHRRRKARTAGRPSRSRSGEGNARRQCGLNNRPWNVERASTRAAGSRAEANCSQRTGCAARDPGASTVAARLGRLALLNLALLALRLFLRRLTCGLAGGIGARPSGPAPDLSGDWPCSCSTGLRATLAADAPAICCFPPICCFSCRGVASTRGGSWCRARRAGRRSAGRTCELLWRRMRSGRNAWWSGTRCAGRMAAEQRRRRHLWNSAWRRRGDVRSGRGRGAGAACGAGAPPPGPPLWGCAMAAGGRKRRRRTTSVAGRKLDCNMTPTRSPRSQRGKCRFGCVRERRDLRCPRSPR